MNVPDSLFILALHNYTRVFDDGKTLRLEWSPTGLKVSKNTCEAKLVLRDVEPIQLPEGSVVDWNQFIREEWYGLLQNGERSCKLRVFDHDSNAWLETPATGATPDIMKQTALALEEVYGGATTVEELKKCFAKVEAALPVDVDDDLRQSVMERWHRKLLETAAATFANGNSTEQELNKAYEVFIQPH